MKHLTFKAAGAAILALAFSLTGCDESKPDHDGGNDDTRTNFFVYDGYSFDIKSAVRYDDGSNSVEFWLSPETGLESIAEVEEAGDFVVLRTHGSFLGDRDRFSAQSSKESYIRFADLKYAYGDQGMAYIEASVKDQTLTVSFLAEKLYTKENAGSSAVLQGSYEGTFSSQTEKPYENEWGLGRDRSAVTHATYTTREDGGSSVIALLEEGGYEAAALVLDPANVGKTLTFSTSDEPSGVALTYSNGVEFPLKGCTGTIETEVSENTLTVSINVRNEDRQFRAQYSGGYDSRLVKLNRYIYEYEGSSSYEGTHEIVKLMVDAKGESTRFFFSPSEGYTVSSASYLNMPVLTIPSDIINGGRKLFLELTGWEFKFDSMESFPYENEYKPHPAGTDWIEVSQDGNEYEINLELTGRAIDFPGSTIDIYYKGQAGN